MFWKKSIAFLKRQWRPVWAPLIFFGSFTVWMTWPLATRLGSSIIGPGSGDNWYYVWLIGWFQKTLFELKQNPLIVPFHNYPLGWNLAYTEITLANVIPALPISLLSNPTLAYNVILLLSFVLSGLVVYWWMAALTRSAAAGLVAGTLFAFAPYRLAHLYGHLPLMGTQYLALHFLGLHFLLQRRTLSGRYAALAGVGLGLAGLSSMYYLYMTLVVSAAYILGFVLIAERKALQRRAWWQNLLTMALIALPLIALATAPYLQLNAQGSTTGRSLYEVDLWSASPTDFFLPAPVHFLWGKWILTHFDRSAWIEQTLYIGAGTLLLVGAAVAVQKKTPEDAKLVKLLLFVSVCAMVLALGTTLHWFRDQVVFEIPEFIRPLLHRKLAPIPLPNYFLFKYLPFYNGMRTWMRYGIYANLFLAVLAGVGYARITSAFQGRAARSFALALTLVLIGLDFSTIPYPTVEVQARPVDTWLAAQPGDGAFVQFPISQSTQPEIVYATLVNNKPFLGMFYGAYLPKDFERIRPDLANFPSQKSVQILHDRGIKFVLVDSSQYQPWSMAKKQIETFGLREVHISDSQHVFEFSSP